MKKNKFFFPLLATLVITGCGDDIDPISTNSNPNSDDLSIITELGFDTTNIKASETAYIVEGDILLEKKLLSGYLNDPQLKTRQAQYSEIIGLVKSTDINVKIDASVPEGDWRDATSEALTHWNSVDNSCLHFDLVESNHDILIVGSNLGDGLCGVGSWPYNGYPGDTVRINTPWYSSLSTDRKVFLIAHELGHSIGLRHTNWYSNNEATGIRIPGTPNTGSNPDPNSIMNANTCGMPWENNGFSDYDEIAIRYLYPVSNYIYGIGNFENGQLFNSNATYQFTALRTHPADALEYNWVVNGNGSIISGQGTNRVIVKTIVNTGSYNLDFQLRVRTRTLDDGWGDFTINYGYIIQQQGPNPRD